MRYQLATGHTIEIPLDVFLEMSDDDFATIEGNPYKYGFDTDIIEESDETEENNFNY